MKKLLIGLVVVALGGSAGADVFKAKLGERLAIPIKMALDSTGKSHTPDSVQVTTYQTGATTATKFRSYTYANATAATGWFDSTLNGGTVRWWLNVWVDSLGSSPTSKYIGINVAPYYQGRDFEQTHSVEVLSYNFDSAYYRGAVRAIGDSTASLATLRDTTAKYVWAYDSATAAGGAATTMGRQLTKDVTATTDTLAAARAVWRENLSAYGTGTFPTAGKLLYLAGDSTGYLDQYSLWNVPFTYAFTAGTMGDSLNNPSYVGNMGYISGDATAADNLETVLDGTGGATLKMLQLDIGGAAGANGAFYVHNSTGPAADWRTTNLSYDAFVLTADHAGSGKAGLAATGSSGSGYGASFTGRGSTGHGVLYTASGASASGFRAFSSNGPGASLFSSTTDGLTITGGGSSGFGARLTGSGSGAGLGAVGGTTGFGGSFISNGSYGIFAQGSSAGLLGYSGSGIGIYGWGNQGVVGQSDNGTSPGFVGTLDSVVGGVGGGGGLTAAQMDSVAAANPAHFGCDLASGMTMYSLTVWAIDTGSDTPLQRINFVVKNGSGTNVGAGSTGPSGYVTVAIDTGTYTILAFQPPYTFAVETIVVTGNITDTLMGYNSITGQLCRVWGTVVDHAHNPIEFAQLTFTMPEGVNLTDSSIFMGRTLTVDADDDGMFSVDLIRSVYLQNKKWSVTIDYPGLSSLKQTFTVPDTTSYRLRW